MMKSCFSELHKTFDFYEEYFVAGHKCLRLTFDIFYYFEVDVCKAKQIQ